MGQAVETGSMLKRRLKSLCCSYGWSYGVFWRFDQRNSMLLTLEDAYYEEQMGVVIDAMLLQVHMLGEGIIGRAAFTGGHQWISPDDHSADWNSLSSSITQDIYQDEAELCYQFSSGIKTIAVISVVSQGVVQFGSTKKILESLEFLDQAKRLFCQVEHIDSSSDFMETVPFTSGLPEISGDPLMSHFLHPEDQFLMNAAHADVILSRPNSQSQQSFLQSSTPCLSAWSTEGSTLTSLDAYSAKQDTFFSCGTTVQNFREDSMITSLLSPAPVEENTNLYNSSIRVTEGGFMEEPVSKCTCQEDFVPSDCTTTVSKASLFDNVMQWLALSPDHSVNEQAAAPKDDPSYSVQSSISNTFSFDEKEKSLNVHSAENDNFDASESWEHMKVPVVSGHSGNGTGIPKCISELDVGPTSGPQKGLFSELGLEQLLEDIVGKANFVTNSSSDDQLSAAKRRRTGSSLLNSSQVEKPPLYMLDKLTNIRSQNEAIPKSQVGLWIDDSYASTVTSQSQRHENHKKVMKKRARPGESTRPRPKDRQLIQDRLKELKELIPNSGKLSIDALLDRTIKHLIFLQSVTKYADRLDQDDEPKLIGQNNGVVLRENFVGNGSGGGGATWAFEVGGQTLVCPIIVEDLGPPGQMLIEMLCEEGGFFLEIADIIRGFSLTILKGVMEVRDNKLWARFTVEANENTTRMDIFMSLVDLLQQTTPTEKNPTNEPGCFINGGIPLFKNCQQPVESVPITLADTCR